MGVYYLVAATLRKFGLDLPNASEVQGTPIYFLVATWCAVSLAIVQKARKLVAPSADELLQNDPRAPVLLLRSFEDDELIVETSARWLNPNRRYSKRLTLEEIIAASLGSIGPVIAIGRPGEPMAPLGAARNYVSHDTWRSAVEEWLLQAGLVVMVMGKITDGNGLSWELNHVRELGYLRKLILVMPPSDITISIPRWEQYRIFFEGDLPEYDRGIMAITFDAGGSTRVQRIYHDTKKSYHFREKDYTEALPDLLRTVGEKLLREAAVSQMVESRPGDSPAIPSKNRADGQLVEDRRGWSCPRCKVRPLAHELTEGVCKLCNKPLAPPTST